MLAAREYVEKLHGRSDGEPRLKFIFADLDRARYCSDGALVPSVHRSNYAPMEGTLMLRLSCTAVGLFLMISPAMAAELTKDDVGKIGVAYMDGFNKKDSKAIMALFTKDGVHVNPTGIRNPTEYYDDTFKAGFDKLELTFDQVTPVTADTGMAIGTFIITGKNDKGEPLKASGRWSDVLVNEGGAWKIRMLTGFPVSPQKVEASAK